MTVQSAKTRLITMIWAAARTVARTHEQEVTHARRSCWRPIGDQQGPALCVGQTTLTCKKTRRHGKRHPSFVNLKKARVSCGIWPRHMFTSATKAGIPHLHVDPLWWRNDKWWSSTKRDDSNKADLVWTSLHFAFVFVWSWNETCFCGVGCRNEFSSDFS